MLLGNVKSRFFTLAVVVAVLLVSGRALTYILTTKPGEPADVSQRPAISPGAGALFGWLGGFRALAADFLWLRMYIGWEKRDLPGTQTLIGLTTAVDPRPPYFWINGARILAYDLPAWRIAAEGGYAAVPAARQRTIDREHAQLAIRRLELARRTLRGNPAFWIEQANIELNRLGDVSAAAESYRQAWALPDAPYYAARLHAELLRRLDRKQEAYAWLRALHPTLPADDESAGAELVLSRIRQLEAELGTTSEQIYQIKKS